jgi:hypothetical protein
LNKVILSRCLAVLERASVWPHQCGQTGRAKAR